MKITTTDEWTFASVICYDVLKMLTFPQTLSATCWEQSMLVYQELEFGAAYQTAPSFFLRFGDISRLLEHAATISHTIH